MLRTVAPKNVNTPKIVPHLVRVGQVVEAVCSREGEALALVAVENIPAP